MRRPDNGQQFEPRANVRLAAVSDPIELRDERRSTVYPQGELLGKMVVRRLIIDNSRRYDVKSIRATEQAITSPLVIVDRPGMFTDTQHPGNIYEKRGLRKAIRGMVRVDLTGQPHFLSPRLPKVTDLAYDGITLSRAVTAHEQDQARKDKKELAPIDTDQLVMAGFSLGALLSNTAAYAAQQRGDPVRVRQNE